MSNKQRAMFWVSMGYVVIDRILLSERRYRTSTASRSTRVDGDETEVVHAPGSPTAVFFKFLGVCQTAAYYTSILYMFSLEFGHLYCEGGTVLSHYMGRFSDFLRRRERYELSSRVLSLALAWDETWLPTAHPKLKKTLKKLAVVSALAGKPWFIHARKLANLKLLLK